MTAAPARTAAVWPVAALVVNAFVWGVSWWPFRFLSARGLHPLWATGVVYLVSALVIVAWRPRALGLLGRTPGLWLVFLASGATNAAFNWAVSAGDVVRVVLLFYLMPLWALLLARVLLREPFTRAALARVALAMSGAVLVLRRGAGAEEAATALGLGIGIGLPDLLALLGGFAFAFNNVMLKRLAGVPREGRAIAMFLGGVTIAGAVAGALSAVGAVGVRWPVDAASWALPAVALGFAFLAANLCLQYGAARLSAAVTAAVMPCEVLFAALTAVWWGGQTLHASVLAGGALILLATLLSVVEGRPAH